MELLLKETFEKHFDAKNTWHQHQIPPWHYTKQAQKRRHTTSSSHNQKNPKPARFKLRRHTRELQSSLNSSVWKCVVRR